MQYDLEKYSDNKDINDIWLELTKFCDKRNVHDGLIDASDMLDNADYIKGLLDKFLAYNKRNKLYLLIDY